MLDEQAMQLRESIGPLERVLRVLIRRVGTIILVALVTIGSALGFSFVQEPTYQASVKMVLGQRSTENTLLTPADVNALQDLTQSVASGATTMPVAQAAVEQLDLPEQSAENVLQNMSAEAEPGTMFVNISYKSSDPKEAQLTVNAIGQALSEKVSEESLGANTTTATVWTAATLPQNPVSPDPVRNAVIALVLGSLLGVALAFLLEYAKGFGTLVNEARRPEGVYHDSEH